MRYSFLDYVVDTRAYSLTRAGRSIAVRPKVFDVLRYLIEHRSRVVGKQELLDALWREPFVDDFAVPWTVSHLRRVLDQDRGAQSPIQTVRGRGYRFVARVLEQGDTEHEVAPVTQPPAQSMPPSPVVPFIGREKLMEQLGERLSRAAQGSGAFVLLIGDAGIGKTRCMDELTALADAGGFVSFSGRSFEASFNPVFWPWIQILRQIAEALPDQAEAARAFELRLSRAPVQDESAQLAESDRYWQYEALLGFLSKLAHAHPLVLSFDDLHWADAGSWELLAYLGPELRRLPILVVAARREGRAERARIRSLPQLRDAERFKLTALSREQVAEYLRTSGAGQAPNQELYALIHSITAGNPWFVRETIEGLIVDHGRGALATLTPGELRLGGAASERLRARCLSLENDVRRLLEVASVLGDPFEIELAARVAQRELGDALEALELGSAEGIVSFDTPRRVRFAHDLVRSVLYEGLELGDRLALHLRAAEQLERAFEPARAGEIAHHYHAALPLAPAPKAFAAAVRAAKAAECAHAFKDAIALLEWAGEAQQNDPEAGPRARAELLLARASLERLAGDESAARRSVGLGIELARTHGFYDLLIALTKALRIAVAQATLPDPLSLEALELVLHAADAGDAQASKERVSALSLLAWTVPNSLDMERSKALSGEALGLARARGDRSALHDALHARLYALSGPDDIDALLAVADELSSLPGGPRALLSADAMFASYRAHLYRCDVAKADAELRALGSEARARGLSEVLFHHDFFVAQRAFSRGEFAESERAFEELSARGARLGLWQAPMLCSFARTLLINEREGMSAVAQAQGLDAMLATLATLPPCYAAAGARVAAEAGRTELAREMLHQLTARDFRRVVKDLGYLSALTNLAMVAIVLEEREQARAIYERLAPYPGHNTPSGAIGFYEGAASRFLGALAAFLGEEERAERYYDDALTLNEQLGALPLVARTSYEYARFLARTGRAERATWLKQRAIELAERFGMRALLASVRTL